LVIVSLLTDGRFIQSSISERGKPLWAAGRDAIILEKKEDMKRRGLASPDDGDALALTFADRPGRSTILNMIPSGPGLRWQLTPAPRSARKSVLKRDFKQDSENGHANRSDSSDQRRDDIGVGYC
jgi:hypothetical protein